jgi:hypothetical protein
MEYGERKEKNYTEDAERIPSAVSSKSGKHNYITLSPKKRIKSRVSPNDNALLIEQEKSVSYLNGEGNALAKENI